MPDRSLNILTARFLNEYKKSVQVDLKKAFQKVEKLASPVKEFNFYLASASTYSSNIEGNSVSLDSFFKYMTSKAIKKTKEIQEIENLSNAYLFAEQNTLNKKNFLKTHALLSRSFLIKAFQGKIRKHNMTVIGEEGIVYVAAETEIVKKEMEKLWGDIHFLLQEKLSDTEIFYYASLIHLLFEAIHPFADGNGRAGRLLEKWFLVEKLGNGAWNIESEKYYYLNKNNYYKNLKMGFEYETINLKLSVPFLLMLPNALK